ncbi:MAG TPA: SRPBCC family protein, partial [Gemmatimonadaceae bacterium]|nr:SRPBCC family protein [Gemmatimonadaceae bacterium]
GNEHKASGVYREIDPPKKLVYTWGWDGDHPVKDSVVTIEFHARGNATEVVLTHAGITDATERANHEKGWVAILDKFEAACSGEGK